MAESKYYRIVRGKELDDARAADGTFRPTRPGGSLLSKALAPGDIFPDGVILNRLIEIAAPGKYTVSVRRLDPTTKEYVVSNSIYLKMID